MMDDANDELLIRLLLANGLDECDDAVARIQTLKAERDAARDAALEEAAKVALSRKGYFAPSIHPYDKGYIAACDAIAAFIRAMKGKSHE